MEVALYTEMQAVTKVQGEKVIEAERELDEGCFDPSPGGSLPPASLVLKAYLSQASCLRTRTQQQKISTKSPAGPIPIKASSYQK